MVRKGGLSKPMQSLDLSPGLARLAGSELSLCSVQVGKGIGGREGRGMEATLHEETGKLRDRGKTLQPWASPSHCRDSGQ